jgi:hypothetical protein
MPDPNPPVQNPPNPGTPNNPPAPPAGDPPVTPPAPPAPPVVPDKYELKLADKSPLDASDVDKLSTYAKAHKLTQEQAAALLKHQEETAGGVITRQDAARQAEREAWLTAVKEDKDLGGDHLTETLKHTKLAMDRFAPEGHPFRAYLDTTGHGNHPEFLRVFSAIGKAMAEDKPLSILPPEGGEKKSLAQRMYPDLKK